METYDNEIIWNHARESELDELSVNAILDIPGVYELVIESIHNDICEKYEELAESTYAETE